MKVSVQKLPRSTVKLTITVGVEEIKASTDKVLAKLVKDAEISGFRKGHAPESLVKEKIDPGKLKSQVISDVINTYYPQAIKDQNIVPIISPRIELESDDLDRDLVFTAETATRPQIVVGDYKKAVDEAYSKKQLATKDSKIVEGEHNHIHMQPNDIVDAILSVTTVEIPNMIIEEEVSRMLSRLVQQLQPLNLQMDAYLRSINKTAETLKAEYADMAQKNVAGEMALMELVTREAIEVTDKEIEETVNAAGDANLKDRYTENPLEKAYIKSIISKNKLLWKLMSELEEKEAKEHDQK